MSKEKKEIATACARLFPSTHKKLRKQAFKEKISVAQVIENLMKGFVLKGL